MLAWSEWTDNGRQKTRNHGYDVIVGGELFTGLLRSPSQTCHAKPKLKSTGAFDAEAFFPLVGCLPQAAWPERLSGKVRTLWHCSRLRSVALYLWLIVVISVRQSTVAATFASLPGAGYGQFEQGGWQPDCKIQRSGRTVREIDVWAESPAIISALLSASSSACRGLLIITVITPLPTKPTKNARELKLANAAITDMQMRQRDVAAPGCKNYTKELADAKAENDALRDDVAAGRRRLHISSLSVSAATTASGVDNAASPDWQTPLNGIISPQRGWSLQKQLEGNSRSILMI